MKTPDMSWITKSAKKKKKKKMMMMRSQGKKDIYKIPPHSRQSHKQCKREKYKTKEPAVQFTTP
jgi:hypothetical protein